MEVELQEEMNFTKFRKLTDIEHVLHRAGMYVGSTDPETRWFTIMNEGKFTFKEFPHVPAIMKLIDEIISNSVDEHRRNRVGASKTGLNRIHVQVSESGHVIVWDNGGIPVEMHPEYNEYIPEMLFGNLRSSSNYDDTEERNVVGTNGVGATLTNIFSSRFTVATGLNGKYFEKVWKDNMHDKDVPATIVKKGSKFKGTKVDFQLDMTRFGVDTLSEDFLKVIEKRCIDAAAANPGLHMVFDVINDSGTEILYSSDYKFNGFKEFVMLYGFEESELIGKRDNDWEFYVVPTEKPMQIGFVNGAECNTGTHFGHITFWCHSIMEGHFKKVHKWPSLDKKEVINRLAIFVNISVNNPAYSSQTKERLTTRVDRYYADGHAPDMGHVKFIRPFISSELPAMILDWANQKAKAEENKKLRDANKKIEKRLHIHKLIEANSNNREECELWLFEGDSAKAGFRKARNPSTQASYLLRGKVMNTIYMKPTDILNNREYKDIVAASGLRFGEPHNTNGLRYGKIVICADMDVDGTSIAALLMTFFATHFPGVIEQKMLYRAMSPIILAKKGTDIRRYYSIADFKKDEEELSKLKYTFKYLKGLAGLVDEDYRSMMSRPVLQQMTFDDKTPEVIQDWFGNQSHRRKKYLEDIIS